MGLPAFASESRVPDSCCVLPRRVAIAHWKILYCILMSQRQKSDNTGCEVRCTNRKTPLKTREFCLVGKKSSAGRSGLSLQTTLCDESFPPAHVLTYHWEALFAGAGARFPCRWWRAVRAENYRARHSVWQLLARAAPLATPQFVPDDPSRDRPPRQHWRRGGCLRPGSFFVIFLSITPLVRKRGPDQGIQTEYFRGWSRALKNRPSECLVKAHP